MPNILIAGAGQLGSRYLQGLSKCCEKLDVWVYDISTHSLNAALERWLECRNAKHQVNFTSQRLDLPKHFNLAIVSSTADVRLKIIEDICKNSEAKYWILEKVLAQSSRDISRIQIALQNAKTVWVNTPRYLSSLYLGIRDKYPHRPPIHGFFQGVSGMACNAIHFIDLVARWADSKVIAVDTGGLDKVWHSAKRTGFYEVSGRISVKFDDGSLLVLDSNKSPRGVESNSQILVGSDVWKILEDEGVAFCCNGEKIYGKIEMQSEITAPLVDEILGSGTCGLPVLNQSAQAHNIFLNAMLDHWNASMVKNDSSVPIT